jgi:hypothetical protein
MSRIKNITMAAIDITVKDNLYNITLDTWDWIGLTVNGVDIQPEMQPDGGNLWKYAQTSPGPVDFTATADYVTAVNPGSNFLMTGDSLDHLCNLSCTDPGNQFSLFGVLLNVSKRPSAKPGPFSFSQGMMTGTFQPG